MTIKMTAQEVAVALGATLVNGDANQNPPFTGVSTDSRSIGPGELFIALKGEYFDGHGYVEKAQARGAAAALVAHEVKTETPFAQIVVGDVNGNSGNGGDSSNSSNSGNTLIAMGRLAQIWRNRFAIPVLALTGSNGKTTVKEMLRAILIAHHRDANAVLATEGNLNNNIGLPLMMLRLNKEHKVAIFEMGMNHLMEIDYLTRLVKPDVALIIQAGTAHIGEVGSREAIAQAKGEIYAGLNNAGVGCVNADDRFADYWRGLLGDRKCISFGTFSDADVRGELEEGHLNIYHDNHVVDVRLHVVGEHNQRNALAAAAGAVALGVSLATIRDGLEEFEGVEGRLRAYEGHKKATIIDDTYNANPDSVRAAIDVLRVKPGKRLLVLGDMGELGSEAEEMHSDVGTYAKNANLDGVFTIGKLSEATVLSVGASGWHFENIDDLIHDVLPQLAPNVTVLVKGSRFMKMERVVEKLVPNFSGMEH